MSSESESNSDFINCVAEITFLAMFTSQVESDFLNIFMVSVAKKHSELLPDLNEGFNLGLNIGYSIVYDSKDSDVYLTKLSSNISSVGNPLPKLLLYWQKQRALKDGRRKENKHSVQRYFEVSQEEGNIYRFIEDQCRVNPKLKKSVNAELDETDVFELAAKNFNISRSKATKKYYEYRKGFLSLKKIWEDI